jgi:tetratricopeptide (TPR) repeat protein
MKILWLGMLTMLSASPALAFRVWPSSLWISKRTLLLGSAERNPIESMDVAEENTPENRFGLQMGAGVDLIVNGNFKEASETIKIALEEFDQNSISLEARAEAMCHMGGALVGLGATEEALECFKKAFQLDPSLNEVADVHNNIAVQNSAL